MSQVQTQMSPLYLRQYAKRNKTLSNGDKLVLADRNIVHAFSGEGFEQPTVFRYMQSRWCYVKGPRRLVAASDLSAVRDV